MVESSAAAKSSSNYQYLWFLLLSFAMVISISNWYAARLVSIFGLVISPGALSFPLSFILADCVTEVYGYKNARLAIWASFFFNLIFLAFGQLVTHLPSPAFAVDNAAFDKLLSMNIWIVVGSFTSYIVSEPFNSYLIAKFKIKFKGKYMGARFAVSTIIAALIDSIVFIPIAFHTVLSPANMAMLIVNIWMVKVAVEIIFIPVSVRITNWLKEKEQSDVYDNDTNFNIFDLDVGYAATDNRYGTV
jgi:uncharacterized integral membrane protein (TIGR00697 family)